MNGVALARVKALADGSDPARASTKDTDAKAVAHVSPLAERARLLALVDLVLGPARPLTTAAQQAPSEERLPEAQQASLVVGRCARGGEEAELSHPPRSRDAQGVGRRRG